MSSLKFLFFNILLNIAVLPYFMPSLMFRSTSVLGLDNQTLNETIQMNEHTIDVLVCSVFVGKNENCFNLYFFNNETDESNLL